MFEHKYKIENNRIVKKSTGIPVPEDEPLFILRAKDVNALPVLVAYLTLCRNLEHRDLVNKSVKDFKNFQMEHPEIMKEPDI